MDPWFVFFLLVAVGALAILGTAATLVWPALMRHFIGAPGSWKRLVAVYATTKPPPAWVLDRQTLVIGRVLYRHCVTLGADEAGLYLQLGFPLSVLRRPPLLIPWNEFKRKEEGRLFWRKAAVLSVGDPLVGTITAPMEVFAKIRSRMNLA